MTSPTQQQQLDRRIRKGGADKFSTLDAARALVIITLQKGHSAWDDITEVGLSHLIGQAALTMRDMGGYWLPVRDSIFYGIDGEDTFTLLLDTQAPIRIHLDGLMIDLDIGGES